MSWNNKVNMPDLLMGSFVGGLLGASVALLFTPKKGRELRKDINVSSKEATLKADEWKETIQEKSTNFPKTAMTKGNELINKGVKVTNNFTDNINEFSKLADDITDFSKETCDRTKELSHEVSDKAKLLTQDIEDTSTEIKDESVSYTEALKMDVENIKQI